VELSDTAIRYCAIIKVNQPFYIRQLSSDCRMKLWYTIINGMWYPIYFPMINIVMCKPNVQTVYLFTCIIQIYWSNYRGFHVPLFSSRVHSIQSQPASSRSFGIVQQCDAGTNSSLQSTNLIKFVCLSNLTLCILKYKRGNFVQTISLGHWI